MKEYIIVEVSMAEQIGSNARVARIDYGRNDIIKRVTYFIPNFNLSHKKTN